MVKIKDICDSLETWAPLSLQESYDNCGLLVGNGDIEVKKILISLDCTEEIIEEAITKSCNLIISHHPVIFSGLKSLTGKTYNERTVLKALKNDIALYAIHTNLDNIQSGVNKKICDILELTDCSILSPKSNLTKLVTFIPADSTDRILKSIHHAGAGNIGNYSECSFIINGEGRFKPGEDSNPALGSQNNAEKVNEDRVEVIFPSYLENKVLHTLNNEHPYEEVAYYLTGLANKNQETGAGMVGYTKKNFPTGEFLKFMKEKMKLNIIRHTKPTTDQIRKVAVCGGSGRFLLDRAISNSADIFITSDFKYHDFFDADNQIIIADIGHYESEVFTKELIRDYLCKNFTTFAVDLAETITNPILYLT